MSKKKFIILNFTFLLSVSLYLVWCLKPYYYSGPIVYGKGVSRVNRNLALDWYKGNKSFGRVEPSFENIKYLLMNPFENTIFPVTVYVEDSGDVLLFYMRKNKRLEKGKKIKMPDP